MALTVLTQTAKNNNVILGLRKLLHTVWNIHQRHRRCSVHAQHGMKLEWISNLKNKFTQNTRPGPTTDAHLLSDDLARRDRPFILALGFSLLEKKEANAPELEDIVEMRTVQVAFTS